jgi:hypothetical protein
MRTRLVPFVFLPLDRLPHTQLEALVSRRARDTPREHDEPLSGYRLVPADDTVEPRERHVHLADGDARMPEAGGTEVVDLAGRELDALHGPSSPAVPIIRPV